MSVVFKTETEVLEMLIQAKILMSKDDAEKKVCEDILTIISENRGEYQTYLEALDNRGYFSDKPIVLKITGYKHSLNKAMQSTITINPNKPS